MNYWLRTLIEDQGTDTELHEQNHTQYSYVLMLPTY